MRWELKLSVHFPHNRFAIGWDYKAANDKVFYHSFKIYLTIFTLTFNYI